MAFCFLYIIDLVMTISCMVKFFLCVRALIMTISLIFLDGMILIT